MKEQKEKEEIEEAIHYLKIVQKQYSFFQPEIRNAIDLAIIVLEEKK